ncbi:MAG: hypothetical protein Q4F95_09050 [Oscillospiraceae bacterium]|nr:hypothetical protein [Oscillospiraceae bacterium]
MKNENKNDMQTVILALILPFVYDANFYIFGTGLIFLIIPELMLTSSLYYFIVIRTRSGDDFSDTWKNRKFLFIMIQIVELAACSILVALTYTSTFIVRKYGDYLNFIGIVLVWGIFFILTMIGGWILKVFFKTIYRTLAKLKILS